MNERKVMPANENERRDRIGELLAGAFMRMETGDSSQSAQGTCLGQEASALLDILRVCGEASSGEIANLSGMSKSTVIRRLTDIVNSGRVRTRGKGRACKYVYDGKGNNN
jgi:hypothetical protein